MTESDVDVLLGELRSLGRFDAPHVRGTVSRTIDGDWAGKIVRIIEQQRRALQTIERMADPKFGFPFTGAGTKLRMGPTVLKKAAEIHTYARAGLGKEEFPV